MTELVGATNSVIARSPDVRRGDEAISQTGDCFASLAMTIILTVVFPCID